MNEALMLGPIFAMVGITGAVWARMYLERVNEMRTRRIDPQAVASRQEAAALLEATRASDNFRNLFEMPVLFYVFCIVVALTGTASTAIAAGAWTFVILRAAHSIIHCTYNRVMHRFIVYLMSSIVLFGLWAALALTL